VTWFFIRFQRDEDEPIEGWLRGDLMATVTPTATITATPSPSGTATASPTFTVTGSPSPTRTPLPN
jgi:hypothetical protein